MGNRRAWTSVEDVTLRQLAPLVSYEEIALQLGRSKASVSHRVQRLKGLTGRPRGGHLLPPEIYEQRKGQPSFQPNQYSPAERALVEELAPTETHAYIAELLGRTRSSVSSFCQEQDISGRKCGALHSSWRGGKHHHNSHWIRKVRPAVLERDGWTCRECELTDFTGVNLRAHHVVPERLTHDDRLENHVTLCQPCHSKQLAHWWTDVTPELLATLPLYQQEQLGLLGGVVTRG